MGEVAVAQVQQQFFDGILNLNPGMVPGIGLIEPFQIGLMLCYLLRMAEWEGELMPLHGEDTAQTVGGGLQIACQPNRSSRNIPCHSDCDRGTSVACHCADDALWQQFPVSEVFGGRA